MIAKRADFKAERIEADESFSDGVTEDIITQLARISDLKVISRTSIMAYKNTTKNLPLIGKELGVSFILEGSVRREAGRVRIVGLRSAVRHRPAMVAPGTVDQGREGGGRDQSQRQGDAGAERRCYR